VEELEGDEPLVVVHGQDRVVLAEAPWPGLALGVLSVGLGAGVSEEMFLRGYIQTRLSERWGPRAGALATAALFGAIHFDLLQAPFAFVLGLALDWLAERTGSILPGMVAHAFNNAAWVLTVRFLPIHSRAGLLALLGVAAAVACAVYLDRILPPRGRAPADSAL
jgi:membrane protease YdiL (CAAX protease family)